MSTRLFFQWLSWLVQDKVPFRTHFGLGWALLSGIPLLFPRVSVGVIAVSLPETQPIMIK
jgi:hypothetical protein